MRVLGLTGSIGTGKSTTAAMFARRGVPVHDADRAVHRLYAGAAAPLVEAAFPGTVRDGVVDRVALAAALLGDGEALRRLETIVHPLVRTEEAGFLRTAREAGAWFAMLDVPLLFETGGEARVDAAIVVSCDPALQRRRVLARPGMTPERLDRLLARQMPDAEKRRRAHWIIDTGRGFAAAEKQVDDILRALAGCR